MVDKEVDKEVDEEVDNKTVEQRVFKQMLLAKKSAMGLNKIMATKNTNRKQSIMKRTTY